MKVTNFIKYLEHTEELKTISKDEILPIVRDFPYCQTGQIMYTIQLNANNSILFENQLKKAASICTDRNKLFEYIHQTQETVTVKSSKEKLPSVVVKEAPKKEIVKDETLVKKETKQKNVPNGAKDELSILEKGYLTETINSSILSENTLKKNTNIKKDANKQKEELFNEDVEHSFSAWLKQLNTDEEKVPLVNIQEKKQDILDQFIQEDPRIKPKKTEFYSPTNMARLSVTNAGIVSETLAIIHVDQGNLKEAINTYEQLILKNPKKRSYFAFQIKILKQKIK